VTHPRPTAPDDYSPHTIKNNKYLPPTSAGAGQPDSAGGQSGGGHHRFRRRGPVSRLLHRGQPTGAAAGMAAGTPTGAAAGTQTGAAAGTQTGAAERTGAQRTRKGSALPADGSSPAAAGPATTGVSGVSGVSGDSGDSGYRPQQRTSRSEQPRISSASASASAPPAPGQRGIEEVNERLDPEQAAREYLAGCRLDEAGGPGVPRDGDRAGRGTSPMPPFPGSARSRAAVPAPFADWVAGWADGPGRPVSATGSFPGRPVPPMPAGSIPSAPSFVMPAPTFASSTASSAAPPTGSSAVSGPAAPPPGRDGNPLYRVLAELALRNLTLVETQLQVMEKLEGHEEDAEQLKLLFRIDHLATRMRRNSENLLVLAGHDGASRDFEPVPLLDVVRAAISEITEYSRAQIASLPDVQVAGRPADDVSHILAELLDNATSKSPDTAVVVVRAERTGDGTLVLTVEDSGIGIPTDQLADINTRLGRPPVLEAAVTRRMGLYVVGRLAERHGLRVQLRERPYGGIAAHVILPRDLFHDRPEPTVSNGLATAGSPTRTDAEPVHGPGTLPQRNLAQPKAPAASNGVADDELEVTGTSGQSRASQNGGPAASTDTSPPDGPETSAPLGAETGEA